MEKIWNNKIIFISLWILTILLILVRDILSISIPFILFSGICAVASVILNQQNRILYILSLLPFCKGLPYSEMILIVLLIDLLFSIFSKKKLIKFTDLFCLIGILVIELINYVYFNIFSDLIIYLMIYMFFVSYVVQTGVLKTLSKKLIVLFSISTIIAVFSIAIREISWYGFDYIITYNLRFGSNIEELVGTSYNSNELGLYCLISTALLLVLFKNSKRKLLLIIAVICTVLGMLSVSRTYIVLIILLWLLFIFIFKVKPTHLLFVLCSMSVVILLMYNLYPEFVTWLFDFAKNRTTNSSGLDNDRLLLFKMYFEFSTENFRNIVFGYSQKYMTILNTEVAVHNAIQESIICWGILGLGITTYWIFSLIKNYKKHNEINKNSLFKIIPIMLFLVYVQTIQLFTMNSYLIIMMISLTAFSVNPDK